MTEKPTNPKDSVGIRKGGTSMIPLGVIYELGLALLEGARKYGRHNWRKVGVRYSVYVDAAKRHIDEFWEGQDMDRDNPDVHNLTKAIACLTVLRDSMMFGNAVDDRPPPLKEGWLQRIHTAACNIIDRTPDPKPAVLATEVSRDTEAPQMAKCKRCLTVFPYGSAHVCPPQFHKP